MSAPIRTCVLGVGLAGLTFHVPFVLSLPNLFTLYAVLERKPASPGGKVEQRFGSKATEGVRIYNSLEQVFEDPQIELVIVATPSETHYEFAKRALEAGKHVLVDKPITATHAQALELGYIAQSKKLVFYPYQNRRWDSDFLTLRGLLSLPPTDPKSLGTVYEFESRFDRFRSALKGTWKDLPLPANGLTYDLAAHLIDQVLVLFGRPVRVTAFIENLRGIGSPEVDDNFTILLHYPPLSSNSKGVKPTSFTAIVRGTSLSVHSPQLRYVVRGTSGTYTKFGVDPQEDQLKAIKSPDEISEGSTSDHWFGVEPDSLYGTLENFAPGGETEIVRSKWQSQRGNYASLFKDIATTIRNGTAPAVKWQESAEVIEIIELAHRSAKEAKTLEVPPRH